MPMITKSNYKDYVDAEELRTKRKYGSSIYLPSGTSIYLPHGEGLSDIVSNITSFYQNNKDLINSGIDTVGKVSNLATNIAKNIADVKNIHRLKKEQTKKQGEGINSAYPKYTMADFGKKNISKHYTDKQKEELANEIASVGSGFQILNE
jgi:hypothetical protein